MNMFRNRVVLPTQVLCVIQFHFQYLRTVRSTKLAASAACQFIALPYTVVITYKLHGPTPLLPSNSHLFRPAFFCKWSVCFQLCMVKRTAQITATYCEISGDNLRTYQQHRFLQIKPIKQGNISCIQKSFINHNNIACVYERLFVRLLHKIKKI